MNRRDFIRTSTLAGMAALSGCASTGSRATPGRDESVVIVGAGIAGIAAGRRLHDAGFRVTLLEARGRVGGRIFTSEELGFPIELGASRLHGPKGNPMTPLIEKAGLDYIPVDWSNLTGFQEDGTPFDEEELGGTRDEIMRIFRRAFIRTIMQTDDVSIASIIRREMARRDIPDYERRLLTFGFVSAELMNAAPFTEASWKYANDYESFSGGDHFIVGGYEQVPRMLAKDLDIRMGAIVEQIDYSTDPVRVLTRAGTLNADRVLVTVPLGVLKANHIAFKPALPGEKLEAIDRMGMGLLNKMAMRFPRAFWPESPHAIAHGADIWGDYPVFINALKYTGEPILVAFIPGRFENALEARGNAEAVAGAMDVLRKGYGSGVPEPVGVVRSQWGQQPFTLGAFSYNRLGAAPEDRVTLGAPVGERVYFAGEATSETKYGSVSGAYLTGERAADEILASAPLGGSGAHSTT